MSVLQQLPPEARAVVVADLRARPVRVVVPPVEDRPPVVVQDGRPVRGETAEAAL